MNSKQHTILIPIDFSDLSVTSVLYAKELAQQYQSRIYLLHILETSQFVNSKEDELHFKSDILPVLEDRIESFITIHWPELVGNYSLHISGGKINKEINSLAQKIEADLIVMGTHGTSANDSIDKFVLGSNAYRTVYAAKCPVITVRENFVPKRIEKILLPLDLTKHTEQKLGLAKNLALALGAKIRILTVNTKLSNNRAIRSALSRKMISAKNYLAQYGIDVEYSIIHARDISRVVVKTAQQENADLVVIMTRQETLLSEWTIGGQARKVIEDCHIPVLSIHPTEEFVSA